MRSPEITVEGLAKLNDLVFLDVREGSERDVAYIPDSLHIPLGNIKRQTNLSLSKDCPIVVYCASGCRSLEAAKILSEYGYKNIYSLKGGMQAWLKANRKVIMNSELNSEQLRRYSRQITLPQIGVEGQKTLLASKILIVGAGGLGSPAALYLAAAGVGTIGIADNDRVELDNLHRQILHTTKSIGEEKTKSASKTISNLNPNIKIKVYQERVTSKNASKIFDNYDVILDGSDNFETRYVVNKACVRLGIPLVHGSILRFQGQVSVLDPSHNGPCYACIYPEPPPPEIAPSCVEAGVLGAVPGIIGTMQALETIKLILNFGEPLIGKLLIFDGLTCKMKVLEVMKDPNCKVCGDDKRKTNI